LDILDAVPPQLVRLIPPQLDSQMTNLELTLSNYATNSGINAQTQAQTDNSTALGQAFDQAKMDDSFYLPPEAFDNPEFKRGPETVPLAGRQGRPDDHLPRG
jgi:RND superfamily putative drug exporter